MMLGTMISENREGTPPKTKIYEGQEPGGIIMNSRKMNVKTTTTVSTTYFTYDHINKKIDGTMENFELSGIPGSAQDLALMACQKAHPDYDFRIVKLKKEKKDQVLKLVFGENDIEILNK